MPATSSLDLALEVIALSVLREIRRNVEDEKIIDILCLKCPFSKLETTKRSFSHLKSSQASILRY
jgi:hypothetical protein